MSEIKPTVIAITGGSGSGKTSLLRAIRSGFTQNEVAILSQDDYYLPRTSQQKDPNGYLNFDLPAALDLEAMEKDVLNLCDGNDIYRPFYVFNNEKPSAEGAHITRAPVIILEGLFLFTRPAIAEVIQYRIYIHAREDLKLIRRIQRDLTERNYDLPEILHRYQYHVFPAYHQYISDWRENADIVINNNVSFSRGLELLTHFIRWQLREVGGDLRVI